jgi:hypothetical protein
MFLTNKWNIKEVLLFPAMKPEPTQAQMQAAAELNRANASMAALNVNPPAAP